MAISIEDLPRLSDTDREALADDYTAVQGVPSGAPSASLCGQRRVSLNQDHWNPAAIATHAVDCGKPLLDVRARHALLLQFGGMLLS